jgi:hypothetical protein
METRPQRSRPVPSRGSDVPRESVVRLDLAPLRDFVGLAEGHAMTLATSEGLASSLLSCPRRLARLHRIHGERERFESAPGRSQERVRIRWHLSDVPGSMQLPGSGGTLFTN